MTKANINVIDIYYNNFLTTKFISFQSEIKTHNIKNRNKKSRWAVKKIYLVVYKDPRLNYQVYRAA